MLVGTKIHIIDNSGIILVKNLKHKPMLRKVIKVAVKKSKKKKDILKKKNKLFNIYLTTLNKNLKLKNSFYLRCFKNTGIVISNYNDQKLIGTRIKKPVLILLRKLKIIKFLSLVPFFLC